MLSEYLEAALESAHYEIMDDQEPYYGHIPSLQGVWASGETLEKCRRNLREALEDWVLFSVSQGLELPEVNGFSLVFPTKQAL
ncbi:MAG: type II toxin-antitoxin system HicB family antitoxin [Desulfomonilaceae bacterium]